jgi:hypothetical protein
MNALKLGGTLLIGAGTVSLALGTVSYGRDTQKTSLGPFRLSVREERTFHLPVKLGMGAIAVGAASLLFRRRPKA